MISTKINPAEINAEIQRRKRQGFHRLYSGKDRLGYVKHLEFFAAGAQYSERAAIAANRVGKSYGIGGYETALHLTGLYPEWWIGKRFDKPVEWIAAGDTHTTTRDIIQEIMLGPISDEGTGLIPGDLIVDKIRKSHTRDAYEKIIVKHVSGGESVLKLMAYEQGRKIFQGVKANGVWFDEESDRSIWEEAMMRTMTTNGIGILTYTPLTGWSQLVTAFLAPDRSPDRWAIGIGWDDAPHLSQEQKDRMISKCEPHLVDARSKGIPSLGSGAIYPISDNDIMVDDFELPDHWPRWYGMDVGWNWTAAAWFAWDKESDTVYLYHTYKAGKAEPAIHYQAIKAPGDWIQGACDYAGTDQSSGERIIKMYQDLGLKVSPCIKGREAGIYAVWSRLAECRLKVFKSRKDWFTEKNLYRRDEKGKIVKDNDHLMDASQYAITSMDSIASIKKTKPYTYKIPSMAWN